MNNVNNQLVAYLKNEFALDRLPGISINEVIAAISIQVNKLIQNDFQKLVQILYRLDVSENKLKYMLQAHKNEEAGNIIAALIVERELQRIKTREQFSKKDKNVDEEEQW